MIKITSKQHLFRRCGIAHPTGATEYPDSKFTEKELDILKKEPMLSVVIVPDPALQTETKHTRRVK